MEDKRAWADLYADWETAKSQRDRLKVVLERLATRFKHGDAPENCPCTGCVIEVALREVE